MAQVIRRLARAAAKTASGMTRLTLANLGGPGSLAPTIAPALGLGLGLLVFVASIQANILNQVNETTRANLPSLFFLEIKNAEIDQFDQIMAAQGVAVDDPEKYRRAPLILGRVTQIKGQPVIPENVAEDERWVVENELFMPYVGAQPPEADIVEGEWWVPDYTGPLLVSVETDAARGMSVGLGDSISFRISGREVTATIASLRNVDWGGFGASATTSFVFSPGTLEASNPQHRAIARTEEDIEADIVKALGAVMPDVIVFQTRETLEAAVRLLGNISVAINAAASIVMLSGLLVLIGAFAAMARQLRNESALLKTFGATRGGVLGLYAGEFALSGAVATLFGALMGVGAAWPVVTRVFEAEWIMPWGAILIVSSFAILAAALGGIIVGITTLAHPPARVLRSI
jgi:putative ABC transport system permease protein